MFSFANYSSRGKFNFFLLADGRDYILIQRFDFLLNLHFSQRDLSLPYLFLDVPRALTHNCNKDGDEVDQKVESCKGQHPIAQLFTALRLRNYLAIEAH